jgi:hypothetical protein
MKLLTTSIFGAFLGFTLLNLAGCPDRTISTVDPQQGRVEYKDIPVTVNRDIDILFIIDDSPSMNDKQANLQANFGNFIDVLQTIPGGLPNVHIGVATSDVGSTGQNGPGPQVGSGTGSCSGAGKAGTLQLGMATGAVTGLYISDVQPQDQTAPRAINYDSTMTLAQVFGLMARVGAKGCGFEQHIEAAKRALSPTNPANQGAAPFLRASAYLAIIFIADEDDCSLKDANGFFGPESAALGALQSFRCTRFGVTCDTGGADPTAMNQVGAKDLCHPNDNSTFLAKVADYAAFFKALKADPQSVIVAGIIGTSTPFQVELRAPQGSTTQIPALAHSCNYQGATGPEVADPPTRIQFLLDQFPGRSTFTTICQQNLTDGLQLIAQLLKTVIGDPCIEGNLADVDPVTPGDQFDCAVSFVTDQGKPTQKETVVPKCDNATTPASSSNKPCWHLDVDMPNCPNSDHLKLKVEGQDSAAPNTHIIANCVTTATP